jgi:hypothetical protein
MSPTEILPVVDDNFKREEVAYKELYNLSGDKVTAYKQFKDLNGDILEPGDRVRITTTIGALEDSNFTYIENIQLPANSTIEKNKENEIISFAIDTGSDLSKEDLILHRDVSDKYEFMIDDIELNTGEKISFSYEFIYG